jgi:succinate dehydrogenase / fumarate reductase flavoprotein subunit
MIGSHDVLVVGAGLAGMRAAIAAADAGADVALLSKLHPTRSHSGAAEGGINAALGNSGPDSPESHAFDTVKGSDYLGDQDAIEVFASEAPGDIYELERWGCIFSRDEQGESRSGRSARLRARGRSIGSPGATQP